MSIFPYDSPSWHSKCMRNRKHQRLVSSSLSTLECVSSLERCHVSSDAYLRFLVFPVFDTVSVVYSSTEFRYIATVYCVTLLRILPSEFCLFVRTHTLGLHSIIKVTFYILMFTVCAFSIAIQCSFSWLPCLTVAISVSIVTVPIRRFTGTIGKRSQLALVERMTIHSHGTHFSLSYMGY